MKPPRCSLHDVDDACACSPAQGLSEKGIDNLRADLAKTDAECEEEIRRAVYDNYQHFIGVTQARTPHAPLQTFSCVHLLIVMQGTNKANA